MLRTAYPQGGVNQSVDKGISRTEPGPGLLSVFSRARRDEACGMTGVAVEAQAAAVNLCKTYGAGHAIVRALDNVSVAFERGRFTAVMGPSGSGKSTLMHCMAGLDRPTSGTVSGLKSPQASSVIAKPGAGQGRGASPSQAAARRSRRACRPCRVWPARERVWRAADQAVDRGRPSGGARRAERHVRRRPGLLCGRRSI
jgi:energy-coupling factor transporter ATP-binding protein EcfA2